MRWCVCVCVCICIHMYTHFLNCTMSAVLKWNPFRDVFLTIWESPLQNGMEPCGLLLESLQPYSIVLTFIIRIFNSVVVPWVQSFLQGPLNRLCVFENKRLYLMNQRWWNNEIMCIVLGINQRYFSSKKDSVVMFSACVQEVNLKIFTIFSLFYLHFCFGP